MNKSIHVIDVSEMSEKEICHLLGIKFVPWYKSTLFWTILIGLSMPNAMLLVEFI